MTDSPAEVTETTPYEDLFDRVQTRYFRPKEVRDCLLALRDSVEGRWFGELKRSWYFKEDSEYSQRVRDALREIRTAHPCSLETVVDAVYELIAERPNEREASNMEAAAVFAYELGYYRVDTQEEIPSHNTATQEQLVAALQLMEQARKEELPKKDAVRQIVFMVEEAPRDYHAAQEILAQGKISEARAAAAALREKAAKFQKSSLHCATMINAPLAYLEALALLQEGKLLGAQQQVKTARTTYHPHYSPLFHVNSEDIVQLGQQVKELHQRQPQQNFSYATKGAEDYDRTDYTFALNDSLLISVAAITDVGITRKKNTTPNNEDNFAVKKGTLVIADGMGGHDAGEAASEIVCTYFAAHAPPLSENTIDFIAHLSQANAMITEQQQEPDKRNMGSAFIGLQFHENGTFSAAHVGDSRLYIYSPAKPQGTVPGHRLEQLTEDHSCIWESLYVWEAYLAGNSIPKEKARRHNLKNQITNGLFGNGFRTEPLTQISNRQLQPGEVYLLCSDGLWDELPDERIEDILAHSYMKHPYNDAAAADALVTAAKEAGGSDNITVILAHVEKGSPHLSFDAYQEARLRFENGENPQQSIEILSRYQPEEYGGGYGAVLVLKAEAEMKLGKREAALATLEQAVAADFSDERYGIKKDEGCVTYAQQLYAMHNLSRLAVLFQEGKGLQKLEMLKHDLVMKSYSQGKESQAKGKHAEARVHYREALQFDLTHLKANLKMAESYRAQTGREGDARGWYRKVIALDARHLLAHLGMAQSYEKDGRKAEAKHFYKQALSLDTKSIVAEQGLERIIDNPQDWYEIGKIVTGQGNHSDARRYYRRVLASDPKHLKANLKMAESYRLQTGREVDARAWYRKVIELSAEGIELIQADNLTAFDAASQIATTYKNEAKGNKARELYRRLLKRPESRDKKYSHAELQYQIGLTYAAEGRTGDAKRAYQEAVKLQPDHQARNNL